jgi:hypothetical protein
MELWRLDPDTGQLSQVNVPGLAAPSPLMALSPNDDQLAYLVPGASSATTVTGWSIAAGASNSSTPQASRPESVWVASMDGTHPPRHVFDLPTAAGPSLASTSPERVVEIVWTPAGSQLVAITRLPDPPLRARIFLINVADQQVTDAQSQPDALVLLPAEALPNSVAVDPTAFSPGELPFVPGREVVGRTVDGDACSL